MEKFKPTNIKGASDMLPQVQMLRNRVTGVLRKNFENYGYAPIETAMVNYLEVLSYKYDENAEIVREIYKIKDQGERDLGLRFDLTVPFAKFIATNRNLKMPFRRYEIGKVWRNGPVKAGRLREFYQCDIDVVGTKGQVVEAEIIALGIKCYLELGIVPVVKYGNRNLLVEIIAGVVNVGNNMDKVIGVIDRLEKLSKEEFLSELSKFMTKKQSEELLDKLGKGKKNAEVLVLEDALNNFGVLEYCVFSPSLARGLNVYTSTVWEVYDKAGRIASSIGGGGRYDKIITNWIDNGLEYPAVGMTFGLEPVMHLLSMNENQNEASYVDIMVVSMQESGKVLVGANKLADGLRAEGVKILLWTGGKVGRAMEYADKENISHVIVIGEKEVENKKIVIKDMKDGKEKSFGIGELAKIAKETK
ncbi:MAG: histidine--tRNA ligase [Firmicutes bacterium]|nr:histidine--tRNA ligase [Bacillota bacterium]